MTATLHTTFDQKVGAALTLATAATVGNGYRAMPWRDSQPRM